MEFIADSLLAVGALGCGLYCYVLARRLANFSTLDSSLGSAIAVLSGQVDEMRATLDKTRDESAEGAERLSELIHRAEDAASRLELMLASMHDVPSTGSQLRQDTKNSTFVRHPVGERKRHGQG